MYKVLIVSITIAMASQSYAFSFGKRSQLKASQQALAAPAAGPTQPSQLGGGQVPQFSQIQMQIPTSADLLHTLKQQGIDPSQLPADQQAQFQDQLSQFDAQMQTYSAQLSCVNATIQKANVLMQDFQNCIDQAKQSNSSDQAQACIDKLQSSGVDSDLQKCTGN